MKQSKQELMEYYFGERTMGDLKKVRKHIFKPSDELFDNVQLRIDLCCSSVSIRWSQEPHSQLLQQGRLEARSVLQHATICGLR